MGALVELVSRVPLSSPSHPSRWAVFSYRRPRATKRNLGYAAFLLSEVGQPTRDNWERLYREESACSSATGPGRLLAILSERQRAMMIAEYYLDLNQDELAPIFGVRRGTVAATIAQARARMRAGERDAS